MTEAKINKKEICSILGITQYQMMKLCADIKNIINHLDSVVVSMNNVYSASPRLRAILDKYYFEDNIVSNWIDVDYLIIEFLESFNNFMMDYESGFYDYRYKENSKYKTTYHIAEKNKKAETDDYLSAFHEKAVLEEEKESFNKKENINYVYLMIDHNTGYTKIGRSKNPSHREKTLQSQKPTIELMAYYIADKSIETYLHNLYKDKRVRGEWFNLKDDEIACIKKELLDIAQKTENHYKNKIDERINELKEYMRLS